jgi:hypothetical protein
MMLVYYEKGIGRSGIKRVFVKLELSVVDRDRNALRVGKVNRKKLRT